MNLKKELRESVKFRKRNFLAVLYDLVLVLVLSFGTFFYIKKLISKLQEEVMTMNLPSLSSVEGIKESYNILKDFSIWVAVTLLGLYLGYLVLYSVTRYLIHSDLLKKGIEWKLFSKYFGFNLLLILIELSLLSTIISTTQDFATMTFKEPGGMILMVLFVLLLIFIHYNLFFTLNLVRSKKLWRSVLNAFKDFILIPKFYMIYSLSVGIILFLFIIMSLLGGIGLTLSPILMLLFVFYIRRYFAQKWLQVKKDR